MVAAFVRPQPTGAVAYSATTGAPPTIAPEFAHTEDRTTSLIDQGLVANSIAPEDRCVSPSDFGFHNAIRTAAGIRFIDFEFAGWDDPGKTLVDFIFQPRVQVLEKRSALLIALHPEQRDEVRIRYAALKPILRIKWICIIIGVLRPGRLTQMLQVDPGLNSNRLILERLQSATNHLNATLGRP
jgi:hypothetical protein